jgi:hypothetical protein
MFSRGDFGKLLKTDHIASLRRLNVFLFAQQFGALEGYGAVHGKLGRLNLWTKQK